MTTILDLILRNFIPALWIAWLLYWIIAAGDVKPTHWRESPLSGAFHLVPFL